MRTRGSDDHGAEMIIRVRRSKRFLRRVKLMLRMMRRFKCGFCKRFAFPGLFALLVPYAVSAQTVPVSLVLATGPNSVTCEEGRRMFRDVQAIYQSLGVNLRLRWFRCLPNPRRRQTLLEGYGVDDAHWWWDEDYFVGPRRKGDKVAHHALIPPVEYRGDLYIVGQSYQFQCYWRSGGRVSMTSAMMTNAKGAPRYRHSVVAMAHEIGHSLGLEHDETLPVSIMHPAPLASVDASKSWLPWPKSAFEKLTTCKEKEIRNGAAR